MLVLGAVSSGAADAALAQQPQVGPAPSAVRWSLTTSQTQHSNVPFTVTAAYSVLAPGLIGCCPTTMDVCIFTILDNGQSSSVSKPQGGGSITSTAAFTLTSHGNEPANYTLQLDFACFGSGGKRPDGSTIPVMGKGGRGTTTWLIVVDP
jgi:hypothetical protein